ncbi:MAG: hypothetical protein RDU30_09815 [Desulfovibrionaceae bacterium]|nr:hypothetical protein [Desulfovibrionaceae bacterium]
MKIKRKGREFVVRVFAPEDLGDEFYRLAGRFFASAAVRTEIGVPMTVADNDWWFLVDAGEGEAPVGIIGLSGVGLNASGTVGIVKYVYIVPDLKKELYDAVLGRVVHFVESKMEKVKTLQTTCHESTASIYAKHGFQEISRRGQYVKMTRGKG